MTDDSPPDAVIETNVGWAGRGENYFRGYTVSRDLAGQHGYWTMLSLATGHRLLEPAEVELLDTLGTATNASDPRIWPLKFTWVFGSQGGAMNTLGSLLLWLDGCRVGPSPACDAARAWIALSDLDTDEAIAQWFADRKSRGVLVPGFGVPGRTQDERVELGKRLVEPHRSSLGRYFQLFSRVEDILRAHGRLRPNIVGLLTACALDLGFEPQHMAFVVWPGLQLSAIANAFEASTLRPEPLRRMPPQRVRYDGPPPRASPRARSASEHAKTNGRLSGPDELPSP